MGVRQVADVRPGEMDRLTAARRPEDNEVVVEAAVAVRTSCSERSASHRTTPASRVSTR